MNSRQISVSIAASPAVVYEFASNPANLPKWAAGLTKSAKVEFAERNHRGVLDHVVTLPSGKMVMVPLRVFRKDEGSEVILTLIPTPDMSDAQFEKDAGRIQKDLAALKKAIGLVKAGPST